MIEWKNSADPVPYDEALSFMDERVSAIHKGDAPECVWLLEHPPLYTAGTSAKEADLLAQDLPVYDTGRGGQYTYHGPGQRVVYLMLDLKKRQIDVRDFVATLENWLISSLQMLGLRPVRREGRTGVWIAHHGQEKKIAAIGIRIRHGISFHGIALNICPDLSHFNGIVPCGIREHGVTSLEDLGLSVSMEEMDTLLQTSFEEHFSQ